jgi:hypothetical protein
VRMLRVRSVRSGEVQAWSCLRLGPEGMACRAGKVNSSTEQGAEGVT